jgi:hypothetical protein
MCLKNFNEAPIDRSQPAHHINRTNDYCRSRLIFAPLAVVFALAPERADG